MSKAKVEESLRTIVACELDCERRTLRTIKRRNLSIDAQAYAQHANAYLFFRAAQIQDYDSQSPFDFLYATVNMPTTTHITPNHCKVAYR